MDVAHNDINDVILELRATGAPSHLKIRGGYRYIDLKVDESDVTASLTPSGPYAGLQLSF